MGKIADVLQARGELDEALRIRREEELPVFERLGDVRARAVTMGRIADVLQGAARSTRRCASAARRSSRSSSASAICAPEPQRCIKLRDACSAAAVLNAVGRKRSSRRSPRPSVSSSAWTITRDALAGATLCQVLEAGRPARAKALAVLAKPELLSCE